MAQVNEDLNMDEISEEKAERPGKIAKFIYLGLIPFLYTVALTGVLLYFGGYDVVGKAKMVSDKAVTLYKHLAPKPGVTPTMGATKTDPTKETPKVANKPNSPIASGNQAAVNGSSNNPTGSPSSGTSDTTPAKPASDPTSSSAGMAASMERMDPSAAAKIIANMDESKAAQILKEMKPNKITDILSGMDPQKAARLTTMLGWTTSLPSPASPSDSHMASIYQHMSPDQIAALLQKMPQDEMVRQIKLMDNATVAQVLPLLDPKTAGWIISQLN